MQKLAVPKLGSGLWLRRTDDKDLEFEASYGFLCLHQIAT